MRPVLLPALSLALCAALTASATPLQHKTHSSAMRATTAHATSRRAAKHSRARAKSAARPTLAMDHDRAAAIQTALIKQGYLSGEASGTWDAESMAAMQKLQADNGWQTKIVPDSRALIKLGLGPTAPQ
ncbi:MAG TPA: peptidoglycan-binding protein [Acidobacteriaceae bacterium]|nr:peptidoglycan-binding protein [Acidobacteriaceae bacterium]